MLSKDGKQGKLLLMKFMTTLERDEDGVWVAECPSIPGCVSQGKTRDEALVNIREAIVGCLEVRAEKGLPLTIETQQIEVAIHNALAPGTAKFRIVTAGKNNRVFNWDHTLIVVAVERPSLELAAAQLPFMHEQVKRMPVVIALLPDLTQRGAQLFH